jgi:deoxyadenosine/deoxycytidine kinase
VSDRRPVKKAPGRPRPLKRATDKATFVAIAGNIGSGKSSLTRLLAERLGWKPIFESVDDNPYLDDFYHDMRRWAFPLQVYFLSNRFRSHRSITEGTDSVVLDRVIYEDAEIFARNLYEIGMMDERDYHNYRALYQVMTDYLEPPDVLVYLEAGVETLMRQIRLRGRAFELGIRGEYLEQLNAHYRRWIDSYRRGTVLRIESDLLDFVNNPDDLEEIIRRLQALLP